MKTHFSKSKLSLCFALAIGLYACFALAAPLDKQSLTDEQFNCWVWSKNVFPIKPKCDHFYVFQGRFFSDKHGQTTFEKLGLYNKSINNTATHSLVFRFDDLIDTEFVIHHIQRVVGRWENAGITINGVQIDYDSSSKSLIEYANFLAELSSLWPQMALSATALVSWHYDNPDDLLKVSEQVDYLAFQLYQIMKPHNEYVSMSRALSSFAGAYRLGVTTHKSFVIEDINKGKNFLGFSVFLGENGVYE